MYVYVCFVVDDVIVVWLFTRFMKREKKKREREEGAGQGEAKLTRIVCVCIVF
jgi:membrane protein implicated in regulation of membrane protease activity